MSDSEVLHIKVDLGDGSPEVFQLDFDSLQWGELEEIETIMGCALEDARWDTAKGVLCLAFIAVRKTRPAVTLDSLRALPMSAIELVDEVPTSAAEGGEDENSGNQS